jgi:hypothetical protein
MEELLGEYLVKYRDIPQEELDEYEVDKQSAIEENRELPEVPKNY